MQRGTLGLAPRNCKGRFPSTGDGHASPAPPYVEATCRYQREPSSERRAVPVLCSPRCNEPGGKTRTRVPLGTARSISAPASAQTWGRCWRADC